MRRLVHTLFITFLIVIFASFSAFAMPYNPDDYTTVNLESDLLPAGISQSKATETAVTRGDFFLRSDLIASNNGDGMVGALAVAYMRNPVDEAYITIYLDQWDAAAERWRQVNYYEAEFYAKDFPDGLTTPTVDISFTNNKKGCYYRLRGVFGAVYKGEFEGFSPTTDGILLD